MREGEYQKHIIDRLSQEFNPCLVLKNDSSYIQGIPDLVMFYGDRWFMLEVKMSLEAAIQPNQKYYVEMLDEWSFAAFICPETEDSIFRAIQRAL